MSARPARSRSFVALVTVMAGLAACGGSGTTAHTGTTGGSSPTAAPGSGTGTSAATAPGAPGAHPTTNGPGAGGGVAPPTAGDPAGRVPLPSSWPTGGGGTRKPPGDTRAPHPEDGGVSGPGDYLSKAQQRSAVERYFRIVAGKNWAALPGVAVGADGQSAPGWVVPRAAPVVVKTVTFSGSVAQMGTFSVNGTAGGAPFTTDLKAVQSNSGWKITGETAR